MDNKRPVFHFRPSQHWINDPNGTIKIGEYYHLFYQYNPYGTKWGNMHWGHARTKDFLTYEVLPNMLGPEEGTDETQCFSGCIGINKDGNPVIIYTCVKGENDPNTQKTLVCDPLLLNLSGKRKESLTVNMEGLPIVRNDWRDPYCFMVNDTQYLVVDAAIDETQVPAVLLFESSDHSLTSWKFVKVFMRFQPIFEMMECPNFFPARNGKWLFLGSPYSEVEYRLGKLDEKTMDFTIEKTGFVDYCSQFYATNTIIDTQRTLLFAFVRGWSSTNKDWNNVISLPRNIKANEQNEIIQTPIKEIDNLHGEVLVDHHGETLAFSTPLSIEDPSILQSEITFVLELSKGAMVNLLLKTPPHILCQILFSRTLVKMDSTYIPVGDKAEYNVRLFVDHTMLELFIDDGRGCCTRVLENLSNLSSIEFRGDGAIRDLRIYHMNPITVNTIASTTTDNMNVTNS